MHYLSFTAEELALDASFQSYCLGTSQADTDFWEQWRRDNPSREEVVFQARQLVLLLSGAHTEQQLMEDRMLFRSVVAKHMEAPPENRTYTPPVRSLSKYIFRAAAVVIAFSAAAVFFISRDKAHDAYATWEVSNAGEKKFFYLPDSTKVTLNAGSSVKISEHFNRDTREIELDGEAFFVVRHNEKAPFIIHTRLMDIRVLGTTFNVKAYAEDSVAETSLLEGSVEVTMRTESKEKIVLKPHEKIILPAPAAVEKNDIITNAEQQPFMLTHLTYDKTDSSLAEVSWTASRLVFSDQSFGELARTLERWYNVHIRFHEESVRDFRFTATFEQKSIEQVLKALQLSRQFKYTIDDNEIIIGK